MWVLTIFRKGAVADGVGALVGVQVAQGAVGGLVNILVVQDMMPEIHTQINYTSQIIRNKKMCQ